MPQELRVHYNKRYSQAMPGQPFDGVINIRVWRELGVKTEFGGPFQIYNSKTLGLFVCVREREREREREGERQRIGPNRRSRFGRNNIWEITLHHNLILVL